MSAESWGVILGVHIPAQRCSAERMPPKPLCACNSTPDSFLFKQDETGGRQQRLAWDQKAVKHSCFVDSDGPHPTCKTHGGAEWSAAPMPPSPRGRGVKWAKREKENKERSNVRRPRLQLQCEILELDYKKEREEREERKSKPSLRAIIVGQR